MTTTSLASTLAALTDYEADEWTKALVHLPADADDEGLAAGLVELAKAGMPPDAAVKASYGQRAVLTRDVRVRREGKL